MAEFKNKMAAYALDIRAKEAHLKAESQTLEKLKIEGLECILENLGFKNKVVKTLKEQTPKMGVLRVVITDGDPNLCFFKLKQNGEISAYQSYVNGLYGTLYWYRTTENVEKIIDGLKHSFEVVPNKELTQIKKEQK